MTNIKVSYLRIFISIFLIEVFVEGFVYQQLGPWIYGQQWLPGMIGAREIHLVWLLVITTPLLYWWTVRQINIQQKYQRDFQDKESEFDALFYHNSDLIFAFDLNGNLTNINPAAVKALGYSKGEISKLHRQELIVPEKREETWNYFCEVIQGTPREYESTLVHQDGHLIHVHARNIPIYQGGKIVGVYAIDEDITERKSQAERIWRLAHFDALTQLPNRKYYIEMLEKALEASRERNKKLAVLFVDLDRFKQINDSLGHDIGDVVLRIVADRLADSLKDKGTVARFGGDEFLVLVPDVTHVRDVEHLASSLLNKIHEPVTFDGYEFHLSASVGIAMSPTSGITSNILLKNADVSMYEAKRSGRGWYKVHMPSSNEFTYERLKLENDLHKALQKSDELFIEYQPQFSVESGEIVGAEALLRWQHPVLGQVSPAEFISLAEESGLIVSVGEYVLERVCQQLSEWREQGVPHLVPISLNISPIEIHREDFVPKLKSVLKKWGVPPEWVAIEITETAILKNERETIEKIKEIREFGTRIFIDDFGRGYSSLQFLKSFPIDALKVDRLFTRDIVDSEDDLSILSGLVMLAHSRNLTVIAEGIETNEQLLKIQECHCDEYQGFWASHPMAADSLVQKYFRE